MRRLMIGEAQHLSGITVTAGRHLRRVYAPTNAVHQATNGPLCKSEDKPIEGGLMNDASNLICLECQKQFLEFDGEGTYVNTRK